MIPNASRVFHAGGRTVASMGNRSPAGLQGRRVFLAYAGHPDTWTSWPGWTERSASRTEGIRGRRSASWLDFASIKDDRDYSSLKVLLVLHASIKSQKDFEAGFLRQKQ